MPSDSFFIIANVRMSRRLYVNQIWGPKGQIAVTYADLGQCLAWVFDQGQRHVTVYRAEAEDDRFTRITIEMHDLTTVSQSSFLPPWSEV